MATRGDEASPHVALIVKGFILVKEFAVFTWLVHKIRVVFVFKIFVNLIKDFQIEFL
jgi:hypothetical protein